MVISRSIDGVPNGSISCILFLKEFFLMTSAYFYSLAAPCGMWDLSISTRDQTHPPAVEARSLNHKGQQGSPRPLFFMAERSPSVHAGHVVFAHPSADGQLGCLRVLATVNSVTMDTTVHASFPVTLFSGVRRGVGLLRRMVVLFVGF